MQNARGQSWIIRGEANEIILSFERASDNVWAVLIRWRRQKSLKLGDERSRNAVIEECGAERRRRYVSMECVRVSSILSHEINNRKVISHHADEYADK